VFHKALLQDGTKIVTLCDVTIFAPAAPPKKLTKRDIRCSTSILQSGWEGRKFSWRKLAKKASPHVSPKAIKRALN
jgi:hypothetical protein